jgi:hypothetical protein
VRLAEVFYWIKYGGLIMKKLFLAFFLFSFFPFFVFSQETVTIATYYPAPHGIYASLRLYPSVQPKCTGDNEGMMYYDKNTHRLMVCTTDYPGHFLWLTVIYGIMPPSPDK